MNEVLVGVCSNDVLFTMSSDEVSLNIEGNRLARLAGHLLQQQSFSPQFPVPQSLLSQVCTALCSLQNLNPNTDVRCLRLLFRAFHGDTDSTICASPSTGSSALSRTC
jgi:hypothetical protein